METIEGREDENDAKDAEDASQEPSERVTLEEYVATREQGACDAEMSLAGDYSGEQLQFQCEIIGPHSVHMERGEGEDDKEKNICWKLIWEVKG